MGGPAGRMLDANIIVVKLRTGLIDWIYVRPSDVKDVDLSILDGEQHAVAADHHLANFFDELPVFRRERKCLGRHAELSEDCSSEFASPLLSHKLAPEMTAPFIGRIGARRLELIPR